MPEDAIGIKGFAFFTPEDDSFVNTAAVRAVTEQLFNPTTFEAATDSFERVKEAAQDTAKAGRGTQLPDPAEEFSEGYDFSF